MSPHTAETLLHSMHPGSLSLPCILPAGQTAVLHPLSCRMGLEHGSEVPGPALVQLRACKELYGRSFELGGRIMWQGSKGLTQSSLLAGRESRLRLALREGHDLLVSY